MHLKHSEKPNIILITLDDFCYEIFIQNIDKFDKLKMLSEKSVFFKNAFSIGPVTKFSFPGIIAGIYPYHFGVGIDSHIETIGSVLKNNGYNTAFINESMGFLTPFFGYCKSLDYHNHFLHLSDCDVDKKFTDRIRLFISPEKIRII